MGAATSAIAAVLETAADSHGDHSRRYDGPYSSEHHYYSRDAPAYTVTHDYAYARYGPSRTYTNSTSSCSGTCNAIIGGTIGGVVFLLIVGACIYSCCCGKKDEQQPNSEVVHAPNTSQPDGASPQVPPPPPQQLPIYGQGGNMGGGGGGGYNGYAPPMPPSSPGGGVVPLGYAPNPYAPAAPAQYGYQPQQPQLGYPIMSAPPADGGYGDGGMYYARAPHAVDVVTVLSTPDSSDSNVAKK
ncbi:hypothetical protein NESM_000932200 [Novymonas esmeraldas]|uniref:Uncharacterized protein n=1 Tax=Novymonas esmeraldas TaxID=1808958 RepID=A0AAW0F2V8_9TRYP